MINCIILWINNKLTCGKAFLNVFFVFCLVILISLLLLFNCILGSCVWTGSVWQLVKWLSGKSFDTDSVFSLK